MSTGFKFTQDSQTVDLEDYFVKQNIFSSANLLQLWGWGYDLNGELGDNSTSHKSSPVQTSGSTTDWKTLATQQGDNHSAAIKKDGTLWLWGANGSGQLGRGGGGQTSPVPLSTGGVNWSQVSCGGITSGAVRTDGSLWMWGSNANSQLGDNTIVGKSSPVQTITAGTTWSAVSVDAFDVAAIKTDGTLWTWGFNAHGELGDGTGTSRSSPVQISGTNWSKVQCGRYHMAAIKTDGTLWAWGRNLHGEVGDNTSTTRSSPVQEITGDTAWSHVSCGYYLTAAIKTDGTLWMWGYNNYGELGDNTTVDRSSPVQTVAGGTNWSSVACGDNFTAAIKTDGTLWTWGQNTTYGELGDNTVAHKSSPIQTVAGGTNWSQLSAGEFHVITLKD